MLAVSEELSNGWKIYYYIDKEEISGQMITILATTCFVMGICFGNGSHFDEFNFQNFKLQSFAVETLCRRSESGKF